LRYRLRDTPLSLAPPALAMALARDLLPLAHPVAVTMPLLMAVLMPLLALLATIVGLTLLIQHGRQTAEQWERGQQPRQPTTGAGRGDRFRELIETPGFHAHFRGRPTREARSTLAHASAFYPMRFHEQTHQVSAAA
jgi:hypothetical protein